MSMEIPLVDGLIALVDDEDYEILSKYKWSITRNGYHYARRGILGKDKIQRTVLMHRQIMNAPKGIQVDHINGNKLDNRKTNLRLCNNQENHFNMGKPCGGTSKYKGVSWNTEHRKWVTQIGLDGATMHLGYFNNEEDAARAYDDKAKELFGPFAKLNDDKPLKDYTRGKKK